MNEEDGGIGEFSQVKVRKKDNKKKNYFSVNDFAAALMWIMGDGQGSHLFEFR